MTLVAGWLPDSDVVEVGHALVPLLPAEVSVLVTSIDSLRDPQGLARVLAVRLREPAMSVRSGGVLVESRTPSEFFTEAAGFLVGFTELWLFDSSGPRAEKPSQLVLTSEQPRELSAELAQWMLSSGCIVGLGDGFGTNYVLDQSLETAIRISAR